MSEWIIALSVAIAIFAPFGAVLAWDIIEEKRERRLDEKNERRYRIAQLERELGIGDPAP